MPVQYRCHVMAAVQTVLGLGLTRGVAAQQWHD